MTGNAISIMIENSEAVSDQNIPELTPEVLVPRLGEYLIECGLITEKQLAWAIEIQTNAKKIGKNELLGRY
jgi:hypothetical protein